MRDFFKIHTENNKNIYQKRGISTLEKWQHPTKGGFSGGPDQIPHLATTYAAINSLAIIGTKEAYDVINR